MWYHPAAFGLGIRDIIAAWLVCTAIAVVFFGWTALEPANDAGTISQDAKPSASRTPSSRMKGSYKAVERPICFGRPPIRAT
jgi:hypothetical protein